MTENIPLLSIIIISYNTRELTLNCLESVIESIKNSIPYEIILVDNNSTDDSLHGIRNYELGIRNSLEIRNWKLEIIANGDNVGFAKANNQGIKAAKGKYILFLNSDTLISAGFKWKEVLGYLGMNKMTGALTVRVELESGRLDPACHRGFPTLWRSFTYYSGLEKLSAITGLGKGLFGGYHLLDRNFKRIHEVESPSGAFFLVKKEILDRIGGFDEQFFMYGEDLDLAWRIKNTGHRIEYYPHMKIIHLKYRSGLKAGSRAARTKDHFYGAMKIFYRKHYGDRYPGWVNNLVIKGIDTLARIKK